MQEDGARYVGLDIGTTSIAAAVIDTAAARVVSVRSRPHQGEIEPGTPDEHVEDPDRLLEGARSLLDALLAEHGPLAGIGVTGQMHGILYLDEAGRAVSPLYTWLDARARRKGPDGRPYLDAMQRLTGCRVPVGFGAATHFVNLRTGAVPPEAHGMCGIPEYVAMHLAGASSPVTDPTLAHGLGLYDSGRAAFDRGVWARLGEPVLELPRVDGHGLVLGAYEGSIPVCTPLGDNQASFLGSVQDPSRSALVNVGTSAQISALNDLLRRGRNDEGQGLPGMERRPYPGGRTLYVGASLTGGKALQLLASLVAEIMESAGAACDPYERMAQVPDSLPGPSLRVDTRFAGSRTEPEARGSITGITLRNFTLGHLVHGFCQGIVDELHQVWTTSGAGDRAGSALEYLVGSGNALRTNRLLRERMAATFGRPLYIPAYREEAAVGAALHAAALIERRPHDAVARPVVTYERLLD